MSIKIVHNAGFFSCCSVRLSDIVNYINVHGKTPLEVDSSKQFKMYKNNSDDDVTYDYFEHYDKINILIDNIHINYHWSYQFCDYSLLNYAKINPVLKKYFSPSKQINDIIENLTHKYMLDYDNICVLFYRGNDKITETFVNTNYNEYDKYINSIISTNPNIKFLIQSDETEFIERMIEILPNNSFYFKDEIRHMKRCNNTVDVILNENNYMFSKYYLAITFIMSKCGYVICNSGNCSIWITFFRGNNHNVFQLKRHNKFKELDLYVRQQKKKIEMNYLFLNHKQHQQHTK